MNTFFYATFVGVTHDQFALQYESIEMPVPRRRNASSGFSITKIPSMALKLFNADFIFQKTKLAIFYGFAPAVVYLGMTKEPCPSSWFELINILE